jgi:hypothetical protein
MKKRIIYILLLITLIITIGTISAIAQSTLIGKYSYQQKIDEGRNTLDLIFEVKSKNVAVYRNEQDGSETQKRFGIWAWNKKNKQITIIMPPVKKNAVQGQEIKLTFVFKIIGNNLKLVKDLPYKEGIGNLYEK